jgi:hypothetical protein
MNMEQAKQNIGKLVMSYDAGYKMIRSVSTAHGPYRLIKINRHGLAILVEKIFAYLLHCWN